MNCLAISPDDRWIATASDDQTVKLWKASGGAQWATLVGHRGRVLCVAFSPDGKRVASGGDDATIRIWNASDGAELAALERHSGVVTDVALVQTDCTSPRPGRFDSQDLERDRRP